MKKQTYKKLFTVATASAMAAGAVVAVAPAQADAASPFKDLKETNTHYSNIVELTQRGVITGYQDGTFRAGESINRAQAAKIIAGVLGLDTKNVTNPGFSDVSVNNANYGSIAALANAGIINGFEGKYNPAGTLTRGQMAKIIDNAFNLSGGDVNTLPFTDVQKSQYKVHIADLLANKVTTGVTATKFDEKSPVTRGQLASFVARAEKEAGTEGGSEKPGTDTPGATTSTVEKAVTLLNVTNNLVTINGEQFDIAPEVVSIFNAANAAALKEADTTLVIEYTVEKTASLANVAAKKGKIVGVKSLKITQSGVKFDAKGYTIPSLSVTGNNVTVSNVVTPALDVAAGNTVTLNGVTATTITLAKGAKVTIDANTKLTTIKLASGDKIENVITNYAAVKDQLKDTKVEGSSTGGGGGSSTDSTSGNTLNKEITNYVNRAESAVVGLNDKLEITSSISLSDKTLTMDITTADTTYVWADLAKDVDKLIAHLKPIKSDTEKYVSSITINGKEISSLEDNSLQTGQLLAEQLFKTKLSLADLQNTKLDFRSKIEDGVSSTVVVKFKNSTRVETYTVKVNNKYEPVK